MKKSATLILLLLFSSVVIAQNNPRREQSPLDATNYGVVYDIPATKNVKVKTDVPYSGNLKIDIYSPPDAKAGEKRAAVVFLNTIGDRPGSKLKDWEIYRSFPRLIAAHGMVGISMEADAGRIQENLRALFEFLAREGAAHGIDGSRLGVYAASANVTQTNRFLLAEDAPKNVRAAVLYYGASPDTQARMRTDLPVLFIFAEGDAARMGAQMAILWQRVMDARAPWTLIYASRMPHAFDSFEDTDEARRIIQQTIAFWKSHLEPVPQPGWEPSEMRAIMSVIYGGDPARIVPLLAKYLAANPDDARGHVLLGNALQAQQKFEEAVAAFEKAIKVGAPGDGEQARAYSGMGQIRFAQKRYGEAADNLAKAIASGMSNSLIYVQLAFSQLVLNRNLEAVKSYERALELGIPPGVNTRGIAFYNLACAYIRLKQNDKAFEALGKALDEGFSDRNTLETDTDLAPIRGDARFQQILARLQKS